MDNSVLMLRAQPRIGSVLSAYPNMYYTRHYYSSDTAYNIGGTPTKEDVLIRYNDMTNILNGSEIPQDFVAMRLNYGLWCVSACSIEMTIINQLTDGNIAVVLVPWTNAGSPPGDLNTALNNQNAISTELSRAGGGYGEIRKLKAFYNVRSSAGLMPTKDDVFWGIGGVGPATSGMRFAYLQLYNKNAAVNMVFRIRWKITFYVKWWEQIDKSDPNSADDLMAAVKSCEEHNVQPLASRLRKSRMEEIEREEGKDDMEMVSVPARRHVNRAVQT